MKIAIITTTLILVPLAISFRLRAGAESPTLNSPEKLSDVAAHATTFSALPRERAPSAAAPEQLASAKSVSAKAFVATQTIPRGNPYDANCTALARDFDAIDLGDVTQTLNIKVGPAAKLLEKIVAAQSRHACEPPKDQPFARALLTELGQECVKAVEDVKIGFGLSMSRSRCFEDYLRLRYEMAKTIHRATPVSEISDVPLLLTMYFGETHAGLIPIGLEGNFPEVVSDGRDDEILNRMLEIDPRNPTIMERLLDRHMGLYPHDNFRDQAKFEDAITRLETIDPDNRFAISARLAQAIRHDDLDAVRALVETAEARAPESPIGPYYRAWLAFRSGDVEEARRELIAVKLSAQRTPGEDWPVYSALKSIETGEYRKNPQEVFASMRPPMGIEIVTDPDPEIGLLPPSLLAETIPPKQDP